MLMDNYLACCLAFSNLSIRVRLRDYTNFDCNSNITNQGRLTFPTRQNAEKVQNKVCYSYGDPRNSLGGREYGRARGGTSLNHTQAERNKNSESDGEEVPVKNTARLNQL